MPDKLTSTAMRRFMKTHPPKLTLLIRKENDEGSNGQRGGAGPLIGTMPFATRDDLIDYLRTTPAGNGQVYELSDMDLSGADLSGADLTGAIISNTSLYKTNLKGANLTGAWIFNSGMESADLRNAAMIMTTVKKSSMLNTTLKGADMHGAKLSGVRLSEKQVNSIGGGSFTLNGEVKIPQNWNAHGRNRNQGRNHGRHTPF